jgi:hypothetical protein
MLRLLTDESFNEYIAKGLLRRQPSLNLVRVQDAMLRGTPDPDLLAWAAANQRVLVVHDRQTMVGFAITRVQARQPMSRLIVVDDHMPIGRAIDELEARVLCTDMDEWLDRIEYIS